MQQNSERYRFTKAERISSEKEVELLFKLGKRKYFGILALTWHRVSSETRIMPKILISAPKKQFKKATDRNRIKRMIREAYRLHKGEFVRLAFEKQQKIQIAVVYTGREMPDYYQVEKEMKEILNWMMHKITKSG